MNDKSIHDLFLKKLWSHFDTRQIEKPSLIISLTSSLIDAIHKACWSILKNKTLKNETFIALVNYTEIIKRVIDAEDVIRKLCEVDEYVNSVKSLHYAEKNEYLIVDSILPQAIKGWFTINALEK